MSVSLKQNLKLSQQLTMTPQLQQALKLLLMNQMDIATAIEIELLENPLLERLEPNQDEPQPLEDNRAKLEIGDEPDISRKEEWYEYLNTYGSSSNEYEAHSNNETSFENFTSKSYTLRDHLKWQLQMSSLSPKEQQLGEIIIENLNIHGFLDIPDEEIIAQSPDTDFETLNHVLYVIQHFDPIGIATRTIQQSLKLQLEALGETDPIIYDIVEHNLENIGEGRIQPLLRKFAIDEEDLQVYIRIIKALQPYPATGFDTEENAAYLIPDAYIHLIDDEIYIVLNEDGIPDICLNSELMNYKPEKKDEKSYIKDKLRDATWLIKCLAQRKKTLYLVIEQIVKHQLQFFKEGPSGLKPLVLREIAEIVELHESTISRVVSNKYVSTPFGIFSLKSFFNVSFASNNGNTVGAGSIKALLKELIAKEDSSSPLNDVEIVALIQARLNIDVARRTIAKYRVELNINSSSKRRNRMI